MQTRTDPRVAKRAAQEVFALARDLDLPIRTVCQRLNITTENFYGWNRQEFAPSTNNLAKLALHGLDVLYILTGRRTNEKAAADGQDPQRQG